MLALTLQFPHRLFVLSDPSSPCRTVRVAMQVPVVMSTSLGQIPTVAVQQPSGTTGAAGHATLLANTSAINASNANAQQKVRAAARTYCSPSLAPEKA